MKEPPIDYESQPLEGAYRIAKLIAGYIQGKLSPKEHDELDEWVAASDENMKLFEELTDEANVQKTLEWWRRTDSKAALKKIKEQIGLKPKNHFGPKKILLYAAMVVVIAGALFFLYDNDKDRTDGVATTKEISPGSNKAVLTLADGRKVELDSSGTRVIGEELGVAVRQEGGVVKYGSGQLAVGSGQAKEKGELVYNTLKVPRGVQYKIILSDGTAVWLNSESSLKFPVVFDMYREVELEGEGYFEVSKALSCPEIGLH